MKREKKKVAAELRLHSFSNLKTECIYRHEPKIFRETNEHIDSFIHFYNHERIQLKTGVAPLSLRHSA